MSVFINCNSKTLELFKGLVLADRERNMPEDSDFYVLYWDEEKNRISEYEYATTRFGGTEGNHATVDATEEVKAKAQKHLEDVYYKMLTDENTRKSKVVEVGREVEVLKGRKVPIGTVGTIFWAKEANYSGRHVTRIGIQTSDGATHWTYAHNVQVKDPVRYQLPNEDLIDIASKAAAARNWGRHLVPAGMLYA